MRRVLNKDGSHEKWTLKHGRILPPMFLLLWVGMLVLGNVLPLATVSSGGRGNNPQNPLAPTDVTNPLNDIPRLGVADEPNLTRQMWPFILGMHDYPAIYNVLKGLNDTNIRVAYYDAENTWHPVPFQIDETGHPAVWTGGATGTSNVGATLRSTPNTGAHLPYGGGWNQTAANKTWYNNTAVPSYLYGHICDNDELLFYAQNGRQVDGTLWWNTTYPYRIEVQIQDPVDGGHSWMYIYFDNTTSHEPISADPWYVNYVSWNAANYTITTPIYTIGLNMSIPDIQDFVAVHDSGTDGKNLVAQNGKAAAYVDIHTVLGGDGLTAAQREGVWYAGDNFSHPGVLADVRTAICNPANGIGNYTLEGNLATMPSASGGPGPANDIMGAGDHQAIVAGPIRAIIGAEHYEFHTFVVSGLGGGTYYENAYSYSENYYYYSMTQTYNFTTSIPGTGNGLASLYLDYMFTSVVQFNNSIRNDLQVNIGGQSNNPTLPANKTIVNRPDGTLSTDTMSGAGDPTNVPTAGTPPRPGWNPYNAQIPDWILINSTTHGGEWTYVPRTAIASLNPGQLYWYWHDTPTSSEMGLALGNINAGSNGLSTSPYFMRTIYGAFQNIANITAYGQLLYMDCQVNGGQMTGISNFQAPVQVNLSAPVFNSITPDNILYKDGQNITLDIQCDHAGYSLAGDFSAIDSGYNPSNVYWTDNGAGSYTMKYTITPSNSRPDGVYRIIVNATNTTSGMTSSSNSTVVQLYNNVATVNIVNTWSNVTGTSISVPTDIKVNVTIQNTGGGNMNVTAIQLHFRNATQDTSLFYSVTSGPTPLLPYTLSAGGGTKSFQFIVNLPSAGIEGGLTYVNATADGYDLVIQGSIHNTTGAPSGAQASWTVLGGGAVSPPAVSSPTDILYEIGTTGHAISWTITQGSGTYVIYRNGSNQQSGSWTSGDTKQINVDGLGVGIYNYTIIATNAGGNTQDECDVTVTNTAPSIASPPPDVNYVYGQTGNTITWTVTDPSTSSPTFTIYRNGTSVNSSSWVSGVGIIQDVNGLNVGSYNFTIVAFDGYGVSVQDMVIVNVANDQPVVTSPANQNWVYGTTGHSISWTVTDGATSTRAYTVYRNGSIFTSGSWTSGVAIPINIDGTAYGSWNFTIVATDGLGGSCSDMVLVTVTNDQPTIDNPTDVNYLIGSTGNTISWNVTDGASGVTTYTVYRNGSNVQTGSWTSGVPFAVNVDGLAEGLYNFTCIATDGLGGSCSDLVWVTVSSNPAPSISSPADILYQNGTTGHQISWNITDPVTNGPTYIIYRNGSNVQSGPWTSGVLVNINIDGLAPGRYNYTIVADDGLGMVSQDSVIVTVNDSPKINQPSDVNYTFGGTGNTISWVVTDGVNSTTSYIVYRNGSSVQNGAWINNSAIIVNVDGLNIGSWNYTIVAMDGLGGSCQDMVLVTVTNDQPVVTTPADQNWVYGTTGHSISWTVTDGATSTRAYTVYRNGSIFTSGSWTSGVAIPVSIDGTAYGSWNFTIVATDGLGGSCSDMVLVTVTNDQPTINTPADVNYNFGSTGNTISWTVTDGATGITSFTIYRNGSIVTSNTWTSGVPILQNVDGLSVGSYNYTIIASDGLGGTCSDMVIVTVANVVPTITHPSDVILAEGSVGFNLQWTLTDTSVSTTSYTIYHNSTVNATGTWTSGIPILHSLDGWAIGSYNVTIIANDGYGGTVSDEVIVTITAISDFVDPTITVTSPTTDFYFNTTTPIIITGYANGTGSNILSIDVNNSGFVFTTNPTGTPEGNYILTNNTFLADGYYILNVTIADSVNRKASIEITFYIDMNAPTLSGITELLTGIVARYDQGTLVTINASSAVGLSSVILYYQVTGTSTIFQVIMVAHSPTYTGTIPAQAYGKVIFFRIEVMDEGGLVTGTSWYNITVGDYTKPVIENVAFSPDLNSIKEGDLVTVSVTTSDGNLASGIRSVTLFYSTDNWVTSSSVKMVLSPNGTYQCTLPNLSAGKQVQLEVQVEDMAGNIAVENYPFTIGAKPFDFIGIILSPFTIVFVGIFAAIVILVKRRSRASEVRRFFGEGKK